MDNSEMTNQFDGSEIAVIGLACRFPGAKNVDEFWRNLRDGVESIIFLRDEDIEPSLVDPARLDNPNYVKAASMLNDVDSFDASFFGITPKEAEVMDPQQRVFLECAWQALEHSGYDPGSYKSPVGLFAGARTNTYLFNLFSNRELSETMDAFEIGLGNDLAFLPTRVSHKLNLRGPSCAVHTACSTSLVAVHLACQSLLIDECRMALAGGIAINIPQRVGYLYQPGGIVSPDGHCRPFDAEGQGTIFGSGVGIVVLKRLDDALHDRDTIHAVIKGSAVNNDGSYKATFTSPSVYGQAEVISEALANAGVEARSISYVEAHGTATPLGDPIEIRALTKAFRASTDKKQFCAVGSVKSNVGHLDAAAGVASLIKTVLALKHRQLPPSLHYKTPNPKCEFGESPFYVNAELADWQPVNGVRRAGVSSFGVGGTNAHLILEEAPLSQATASETTIPAARGASAEASALAARERHVHLLVVSAETETALETATSNLAAHLQSTEAETQALHDVAYTLQVGRQPFPHRRAVVCDSREQAIDALVNADPRRVTTNYHDGALPSVAFLFPGQGSQHIHMARGIYSVEPRFRQHLDRCLDYLRTKLGIDLRGIIYPMPGQTAAAEQQLLQTWAAQPALFSVEYALAQLWMEWGVRPALMIGHSLGEYVAACVAGVFSLEDALRLVSLRGRLMQELGGGAMLAVALGEADVQALATGGVSIAALNGRRQSVLSGTVAAISAAEEKLRATGVECHRLATAHAFHSQMMEPMLEEFAAELRKVELREPELEYVSNVTGRKAGRDETSRAEYWVEHVRRGVRFGEGIEEISRSGVGVVIEVGPGEALSRLVRAEQSGRAGESLLTVVASLGAATKNADAANASGERVNEEAEIERAEREDEARLYGAVGKVWAAGAAFDWQAFSADRKRMRVPLPTYPFERQKFWVLADEHRVPGVNGAHRGNGAHEVSRGAATKQKDVGQWFYLPSWKRTLLPPHRTAAALELTGTQSRWLIFSDASGPGDALIEMLREAGVQVTSVSTGESFEQLDEQAYALRPAATEDYRQLFDALKIEDGEAESEATVQVVHLWGLDDGRRQASSWESFQSEQQRGYYSLLALAQAISARAPGLRFNLNVVTNLMQQVESSDQSVPERATALAACKVISQEQEQVRCRSIDFSLGTGANEAKDIAGRLLDELAGGAEEMVVAYRGNRRWAQVFEQVKLETKDARRELRRGGVYLLTGGLGGVGLLLAEYLWREAGAKLALVGRRGLPPRAEWDDWLAREDEAAQWTRAKIERVKRLEEEGAEIEVWAADVADEKQLKEVVRRVSERFGALNGVLHAAGTTSGASVFTLIKDLDPSNSELQFQPKVKGLYALERALEGKDVDFCLLFSSNAAVLGGLGFIAYSAANIFMDAFAIDRSEKGSVQWISANWDHWPEETKQYSGFQTSMQQFTMTGEESIEAFRRVATIAPGGQVVVSTGDLHPRLGLWIERKFQRDGEASADVQTSSSTYSRPKMASAYVAPGNETEQTIANIWQQVIGIERVGVNDNFFDLGGHSLLAIKLVGRLREAFDIELPFSKLFAAPTVAGLSLAIAESKAEQNSQESAEVLKMLAQLSEEEIDAEINKRMNRAE
jgi:acyl transferase domain-containing protein